MLILIGSYLLLVFVLPIVLSLMVGYQGLPSGRDCPHCGAETIRLRARMLRVVSAVQRRSQIQRRWCMECGWGGIAKMPKERRVLAAKREGPLHATTQTLDVRPILIDGTAWRVMLQCWDHAGMFYGRLLFVAPNGRLWLDAVQSFSGATQQEVLHQAMTLPQELLADRLRRLVTEA